MSMERDDPRGGLRFPPSLPSGNGDGGAVFKHVSDSEPEHFIKPRASQQREPEGIPERGSVATPGGRQVGRAGAE